MADIAEPLRILRTEPFRPCQQAPLQGPPINAERSGIYGLRTGARLEVIGSSGLAIKQNRDRYDADRNAR
jgi:hypothetical protein